MIHCDLRKLGGAKLETFSNGLFFCSWRTHRDIEEPRFNRSRNMIFANCTKKPKPKMLKLKKKITWSMSMGGPQAVGSPTSFEIE